MSLERSDLKQAKIRKVDPELVGLLNQAQKDPEAVALVLFGSAASGPTHEGSDLDVWYVRRGEPLPPRERRGRLEIVPTTLDLLRAAPDWLKSALAYAQTIWDETGEVESVLAAARTISHDETAELYDGYLNDFFRSMKAWRMGNELAGRIECGRSLRFLGELVFALDGIRAPVPKGVAGQARRVGAANPRSRPNGCSAAPAGDLRNRSRSGRAAWLLARLRGVDGRHRSCAVVRFRLTARAGVAQGTGRRHGPACGNVP